jgi:hypothetical protein
MARAFRTAVVAALLALGAMMLRAADVPIRFTDVAAAAGLVLPKVPVSAAKDFLIDTTGNGVAFFDYDGDGDVDALIVTGSTFERLAAGGDRMVALFRNDGGRFTDVTTASGLTRRGWGTGVCVADYDNDGFEDIYVTGFTGNVLWHNVGGRRFEATAQAADSQWSTGCAFGDYDRDGYVDLYVANYVRMEPGKVPSRTTGPCRFMNIDVACGPRPLPGEPDRL